MTATILPSNRSDVEEALELAAARLDMFEIAIADLWNPETCPERHLRLLAWSFSVDTWDEAWPEGTKRAVIKASVAVHRRKGTAGAVKEAIRAAGYNDAEVVERWGWDLHDGSAAYDGQIYYSAPDHWAEFRVILTRPISIDQAAQVRAIIDAVKPARAHLKALDFTEALNLYDHRTTYNGAFTHGVA